MIVAGAPGFRSPGGAYLFRRVDGTWIEEAKLLGSDVVDDDRFGSAVGIDGDVIVVGAPRKDDADGNRFGAGTAYVFRRVDDTWTEEAKLPQAPEFSPGSLAIDGDTIVVRELGISYVLSIPLTQLGDRARHRAREGRSRSNGGRFPRVQLRQGNRSFARHFCCALATSRGERERGRPE